jgi:hypothetical protein
VTDGRDDCEKEDGQRDSSHDELLSGLDSDVSGLPANLRVTDATGGELSQVGKPVVSTRSGSDRVKCCEPAKRVKA